MEVKGLDEDDSVQEVKEKTEVKPELEQQIITLDDVLNCDKAKKDAYKAIYIWQHMERIIAQFRVATRTSTSVQTQLIELYEMYQKYKANELGDINDSLTRLLVEIDEFMFGLKNSKYYSPFHDKYPSSKYEYDFTEIALFKSKKVDTFPTLASSYAILNIMYGLDYKRLFNLNPDQFKIVLNYITNAEITKVIRFIWDNMRHVKHLFKKMQILSKYRALTDRWDDYIRCYLRTVSIGNTCYKCQRFKINDQIPIEIKLLLAYSYILKEYGNFIPAENAFPKWIIENDLHKTIIDANILPATAIQEYNLSDDHAHSLFLYTW